jgi:hypothetical protein
MVGHDDIKPEAAPPARATLLYQQPPPIPLKIKSSLKGEEFTISLYAHDDLFDYEKYIATHDQFSIVHGAGEDYVPPIPLLKFPLNLGGPGWSWLGTLSSEENPHPARATITTAPDTVTVGMATFWTVRVTVDMTISPYRGAPAVARRMVYWFEAGHGLIKRDFAGTSIRAPLLP